MYSFKKKLEKKNSKLIFLYHLLDLQLLLIFKRDNFQAQGLFNIKDILLFYLCA